MPTATFAVDIWSSVPDALASAANYLKQAGWKDDQTWGRPVRRSNGRALPRRDLEASLILPDGPGGPAYRVYDNFRVLLAWNRYNAFAVAVGTLSDRLADR